MPHRLRALAVGGAAVALVAAPIAATGISNAAPAAHAKGQKVVVRGLTAPNELAFGRGGKIWVASLATGDVTRAKGNGGHGTTVFHHAGTAVAPVNRRTTYLLTGEGGRKGERLFKGNPRTGKVHQVANLRHYEKVHNPDGQKQCVGPHCDSLSNPYALLRTSRDLLIADAGANDILAYNLASGRLHTFHIFPNIRDTKKCKNAHNNDRRHPGCDPVPTGLARGPGDTVYVSLLGAEAPHAAKVVELNLTTGIEIRRWGHLSSATGVAVSPTGVIYASELDYGLNPNAPDFNNTGRIVRINPVTGKRKYAPVPTPGGLAFHDGKLYSSSHLADALFGHTPGTGRVVRVAARAFKK
jgi:hypothetical protein